MILDCNLKKEWLVITKYINCHFDPPEAERNPMNLSSIFISK